jgi:hypothetical protein
VHVHHYATGFTQPFTLGQIIAPQAVVGVVSAATGGPARTWSAEVKSCTSQDDFALRPRSETRGTSHRIGTTAIGAAQAEGIFLDSRSPMLPGQDARGRDGLRLPLPLIS